MLNACEKHKWRPRAGPGGKGAAGLCPGCVAEADLKSGRTYLDPDEQIREGSPRSKDLNQRRYTELGLVSDGPPVSTRPASPYQDELWSQHLAKQKDTRREEERALMQIEQNRKRRERQERPRQRRVRSSSYQDGAWVIDYQPERRDSIIFDVEDMWD